MSSGKKPEELKGKGKDKKEESKERDALSFLPPDVRKFAKQLGLDLHGLEPEAKHIWSHLEKLSVDNPIEYERFVGEQMQAAKEEQSSTNNKEGGGRCFRPNGKIFFLSLFS